MTRPGSGKVRCQNSTNERFFYVALGTGTAVVLDIKGGHISGTLNGHAISGHGGIEYTYNAGASKLVKTDSNGTANGPAEIPITLADVMQVVYLPVGCKAHIAVQTSGTAEADTSWKHKKDSWKMKGRTEAFTLVINQDTGVDVCDLSGLDGDPCAYDCSVLSADPACEQACLDIQTDEGCN